MHLSAVCIITLNIGLFAGDYSYTVIMTTVHLRQIFLLARVRSIDCFDEGLIT